MEDKITLYPVTAPFCSSGSSHCMTMVLDDNGRTWTFLGADPGPETSKSSIQSHFWNTQEIESVNCGENWHISFSKGIDGFLIWCKNEWKNYFVKGICRSKLKMKFLFIEICRYIDDYLSFKIVTMQSFADSVFWWKISSYS